MNSEKQQLSKERNPWLFIPSQYFAEGLPYILVNVLSVVMLKSMDVSNELIGYTSFLYIPWSIKLFWAPYVDANMTKRKWVWLMQLILAVCFAVTAVLVHMPFFYTMILVIFSITAFISATHDIATDGFYLHALDEKQQAFFTGIRATFYRLSMIFGSGLLVIVAGNIGDSTGDAALGWSVAFIISAVLFIIFFIYHKIILPRPKTDKPVKEADAIPFARAFSTYFKQDKIIIILLFILLYRLGEGLLVKMAQPFLLDSTAAGGLNIGVSEVGFMYGTVGVFSLVVGGVLGGWLIKKYTLKKLIWSMAFFMNLPNALYVWLAYSLPDSSFTIDFSIISSGWIISLNSFAQIVIIIEQFGYGLGFTAFMVYLLYISKGEYKTSHFAISTGFMAVGMMIPGFISGILEEAVGYLSLFTISVISTIPGMLLIYFLPYKSGKQEN